MTRDAGPLHEWRRRAEGLRLRIERESGLYSWLWSIRLKILTFLISRYGALEREAAPLSGGGLTERDAALVRGPCSSPPSFPSLPSLPSWSVRSAQLAARAASGRGGAGRPPMDSLTIRRLLAHIHATVSAPDGN